MSLPTLNEIHELLEKSEKKDTPFLLVDTDKIRQNCRNFYSAFPGASVYFSVKANNHPLVLSVMDQEGVCFDVASWGEIEILRNNNISTDKMIYSAPTKLPSHLRMAYQAGIRTFAFDSQYELEKIARLAPGSKVIARLWVDNEGSFWPLERKFGMSAKDALLWMPLAKELGLIPFGFTFHVGSQNSQPEAWVRAIEKVYEVWKPLAEQGMKIEVINLGGGFPVEYAQKTPAVAEIGALVRESATRLFGDQVRFYVEPGRGLVGNTAIMVTTIINIAQRGEATWLFVDTGVFHGLLENISMFAFDYPMLTDRTSATTKKYIVAGPTCDSADIINENATLPEGMQPGDRIYFLNSGAYSNSIEVYNGLPYPDVVIL